MENNKENQLSDLIKNALAHSIAQAFLIFSGALVIVSIWKSNNYVFLSFFTLIYALINFKIEATRKHLPMGNYGMRTNLGAMLYTLISWSLLIWWIIGLSIIDNNLGLLLNRNHWYFWVSAVCLLLILIWIIIIFYEKREDKNLSREENESGRYEVHCVCENCDLDKKLHIKKGVRVNDAICQDCGVAQQLERKKTKKKNNSMPTQDKNNMTDNNNSGEIIIYEGADGAPSIEVRVESEFRLADIDICKQYINKKCQIVNITNNNMNKTK